MSQLKTFKKGEFLFREGDKAQFLYIIQSGSISVCLQRPKQKIELYILSATQMAGEQLLSSNTTYAASGVALTETKVLEVSVDLVKSQLESSPQLIKVLTKSIITKLRLVSSELRSLKLEKDNSPCPPEVVAKVFASFYHSAIHKGEKHGERLKLEWPNVKSYVQKVFLESPKRLEGALQILNKLKMVQIEMGKNIDEPDEPEQIMVVYVNDMPSIEQFFEFYQYCFFKSGKADFLKVDEKYACLLKALLDCAKNQPLDRHGAVRFEFPALVERVKNECNLTLTTSSFDLLESKGLLAKRQSTGAGVFISFDYQEWHRTLINWRFLREIEKWNERGVVDVSEIEDPFSALKDSSVTSRCPECSEPAQEKQKFCAHCGFKLSSAA
jgi:hypothetical protein